MDLLSILNNIIPYLMNTNPILGGLLIFCMRVTDVSLGTMRIINSVRGQKLLAALIGFVEVTIFIVAISQVIRNVTNIWSILGYSGGFAVGTWVGMTIEERLAMGSTVVRVISHTLGGEITSAIHRAGFGATEFKGQGLKGEVCIVEVVARRAKLPAILQIVSEVDSQAFITVEEPRRVYRGWRVSK